jgi:hypothetical protein
MRTEVTIDELLRWRLASAEVDAPPRPRAAELLAWAQPWWDRYPARFQNVLQLLMTLETAVGNAMAQTGQPCALDPVPTLIVRADEQTQARVGVLHFNLREGRLHFRFYLDACGNSFEDSFEVTFVSNSPPKPLFFVQARRLAETEYRIDAEISPEQAAQWAGLKATDPMPFRLILRPKVTGAADCFQKT